MRLLVTIGDDDRLVEADPGATVGHLLDALGAEPGSRLRVARTGRQLAPERALAGADLRSGDTLGVAPPAAGLAARRPGGHRELPPAAVLRLLREGMPDTVIELPYGRTSVGRDPVNDVVIDDEALSRRHAVIVVDDTSVTVLDAGSTNGVVVGDDVRPGATTLVAGARALLGNTWIEIEHLQRPRGLDDVADNQVAFNRPPRHHRPAEPARLALPVPPGPPPRSRLPLVAALVPLVMAAALIYAPVLFGGRPNYLFGVFTVFSPIMVVGSYLESRRSGRLQHREDLAAFRSALFDAELRLEAAVAAECAERLRAAPAVGELGPLVDDLSPRLWERGPDDPDALTVRVGLADQPSLAAVQRPDRGDPGLRAEADAVAHRFAMAPGVPALVHLGAGGLGISGPVDHALPLGFSVVAQLAALHSPAELVLAALVPAADAHRWDWMKWLPHCPIDVGPLPGPLLAATEVECRRVLAELNSLIGQRLALRLPADAPRPLPLVVVVVVEGVPVEQHELTHLLEHGPAAGVYPLWMAGATRRVPRPVATVVDVEVGAGERPVATVTPPAAVGRPVEPVAVEGISGAGAESLARRLAPLTDAASQVARAAEIPARVDLPEILGDPDILDSPAAVAARWARPHRSLAAPVGRMATEVLALDIRRDGPHCLVAGTTGAGKSELLQTWISSLAATHGPQAVTFLLVDYKGGAAFKDCSRLPHAVGMVTDLDAAGVNRALQSLRAELTRRERILHANDCADLTEMLDRGLPGAPPSLLIVVDEFAALVQEVPEFIEGVVGVAQRGRSLGLHLVLATQRPAGVITPQIRANTDLRIALRVADTEDSTDVIDVPDAAHIDRALPGRAIVRIGPRDRVPFQTAYVGGVSGAGADGPAVSLARFRFGAAERLATGPARPGAASAPGDAARGTGRSDLERLVATISAAHHATGAPPPRRPWLEPLAPICDLEAVPFAPSGPDHEAVVLGMADRPAHQDQVALVFEPDVEGSLGIVGTGGAGKTVALRTIAAAVALGQPRADRVPVVYCLDFAGRGLRPLEALPHVGSVVGEDDPDRVRRLLADLGAQLDERAERFSAVGAASLAEYRAARPDEEIRRTWLLIDGYPAFHQAYEQLEGERWVTLVRRLAAEGRPFGIHLVLTAPRREAIYTTMARTIGRWLVLRQTSTEDYRSLEVPPLLHAESPPGRAVERGDEAQVAILGGRPGAEAQLDALARLAGQLRDRAVPDAPPVRLLPATVHRHELVGADAVGLRDRDFTPWRWPERSRVFLVSGPRFSGRSNALRAIGLAAGPAVSSVWYLANKPPTSPLPAGWRLAVGFLEADEAAQELLAPAGGVGGGVGGELPGPRLVLVDDANTLYDSGVPVDRLADEADGRRWSLVAAVDDTSARRSSYDPLARVLTAGRTGLLLQPAPVDDAEVFGTALPRVRSHQWPAGRGYLVSGAALEIVQVALAP
ncbi:MAG: FtsK/SpoIIIE domain-containing protein [Acidimicrobiales bacterium]